LSLGRSSEGVMGDESGENVEDGCEGVAATLDAKGQTEKVAGPSVGCAPLAPV